MPAPTEHPEPDATSSPSEPRVVDETVAAGAASGAPRSEFGLPTMTGEVGALGPYRIVKELGKGGMGAVYAAIDTRLDRRLALKVMLPEFASDPAAKERFLREARAAAKISHDNVVTVYEADERDGVPYIAMQFLEGLPLDAYLKKKGTPTVQQVLRIASEAAAGLAAAHKLGLVHRDIKPANLWLEAPNGRVKVLDFGLAKPVDAEIEITRSGAVVGTPAYMSPEQARGQKVDHRADLFSLGAVLYRLCTGQLPFHGPTTMAILMALGTEEPPPVREVAPHVPEALAALIHQLLSKSADARPQSAAEVVKHLRAIAEDLAVPRAVPAEHSISTPQLIQPQVMYAVVPVTVAPPAASPFADIDAPASEVGSRAAVTEAESVPGPKPKPKPAQTARGRSPWPLVGGALVLAALVVGGVVFALKDKGKDKAETKPDAPPPVGPGPKKPPEADPDRKVAEWVLAQSCTVRVNGTDKDIMTAAELPKERFTLTTVSLSGSPVADAGLAQLKELKGLTDLDLHRTTKVTDAGLAHLKELKSLKRLDLNATQLGNAGLDHLKELKGLTFLDLRGTKVTATGRAELRAALPACKIEHDDTIEPKSDPDRTAAEWVFACGGYMQITGVKGFVTEPGTQPKTPFTIMGVYFDKKTITDAGLANLANLSELSHINVNHTTLSDVGMAHFKGLKKLRHLAAASTKVTDAGLEHLKELKTLDFLDLGGT